MRWFRRPFRILQGAREKRCVLLLEVLLALFIVVTALIPLLRPHVYLVKQEKEQVRMMQRLGFGAMLWVHMLEKLYRNEIEWELLFDRGEHQVAQGDLENLDMRLARDYDVFWRFQTREKPARSGVEARVILLKCIYRLQSRYLPQQSWEFEYVTAAEHPSSEVS